MLFRDEDGKTPLDKARERSDDGHHEVATLLQSPGDWLLQDSGNRWITLIKKIL